MPYQIKWTFDKSKEACLKGVQKAMLDMQENRCPWKFVELKVKRNVIIFVNFFKIN